MHAAAGRRILGEARAGFQDLERARRDLAGAGVDDIVQVDPDEAVARQERESDPVVLFDRLDLERMVEGRQLPAVASSPCLPERREPFA